MNVKLNDERVKLIAATTGAFALGAAAGILSGMSYFKKKFEAIADEEIESVKEAYRAKQRQEEPCEEQADGGYAATAEEAMDNYRSILTETYGPSPFDEEDDVVEEPVDLRCEYVSPEGVRCRNHARPGSHFCGIHADGQAPEAGADEEEESLI